MELDVTGTKQKAGLKISNPSIEEFFTGNIY
jgi:hypothetical protein